MEVYKRMIGIEKKYNLLEKIYLCCFACYYVYIFLGTTMFEAKWTVPIYRFAVIIVAIIWGIKLLDVKKINWKEWVAGILVFSCYAMQYLRTSDKAILILGIFILASMRVSFRKIVLVSTICGIIVMVCAFIASQVGIIEDLVYYLDNTYRHSFGIVYSTDFAAHIFFLVLGYCYLRDGRLKSAEYIGLLLLAILIYVFCKAKTSTICIILTAVSLKLWNLHKEKEGAIIHPFQKLFKILMIVIIPLCATIMIVLTVGYDVQNPVWEKLNHILNGRLAFGHEGFTNYGVTMFGQYIKGAGLARSTTPPEFYFALDSSYISILLERGIIFFVMLCIVFVYCSFRAYKRREVYLLILLSMMAIQCMIEHHLPDISYNIFLLLLFAKDNTEKEVTGNHYDENILSEYTNR